MKKITVFTRAYNTEEFIEQCIQSVLNQTLTDFEYIIVDNGSTDTTKNIIEKYSQADTRIKRIRLEKNTTGVLQDVLDSGIKGKYFVTLDSDDWYEPDFLENLYDFAEKNKLDIAVSGSRFYYVSNGNIAYRKSDKRIILDKNGYDKYFIYYHQFFRTMWAKLFRTDIIIKADFTDLIKNSDSGGYGSDTLFSIAILSVSNKIGLFEKVLHNYRIHDKSISYNYNQKRIYSDVLLFENSEHFLKQFGKISKENYNFIYLIYLNAITDTINTLLKSSLQLNDKVNELYNVLNQSLTLQMFEYLKDNERLKVFKKQLLYIIIQIGQSEIINQNMQEVVYKNICLLFNKTEEYIYKEEIEKCIKNPGFLLYILEVDKKSLLEGNILLSWIQDEKFILEYFEVIKDIYFKDFSLGLDKVLDVLSEDCEIKFEEELIYMGLNLSASLNDGEVYVYLKKFQAQYFIISNKFEEAKKAMKDLIDICPYDFEVLEMKKYLEESYG